MKLISMCVWGGRLMYWEGALANAQLHQSVYPGWKLRIYTDTENAFTHKMWEYGCEVRVVENLGGYHGTFWRFLPVSEPGIDAVIFRDADSRLNSREAAAVAAWLQSGKAAHVMRDYPHHYSWPMLGGMWGIRGGVIPDIEKKISRWGKWDQKFDDQYFLKAIIWPLIADNCVQHVSGYSPWGGEPFPPHQPCDSDYVGQRYSEGGLKDSVADSAPGAARELALLLACCKPRLCPDDEAAIRQMLPVGVDWNLLARAAVDHDIALIAAHSLAGVAADLVPKDILDAFRFAQEDARRKNGESLGELIEIIEELQRAGIEAIPLNSPALDVQAYGDIGLGVVRELKFLIRDADLTPATTALRKLGYDCKEQESRFTKDGRIPVALSTRLTEEMAVNIGYAGLWQRAQRANLMGGSILTLAPEDALLGVAVHGCTEMWRKIKTVCDVAAFIGSHPRLDWKAVAARAEAQGCLSTLLLASSLARRCFGAALPEVITAAGHDNPAIERISDRIIARWQHAESTRTWVDRLRLHDRVTQKARYIAHALFSRKPQDLASPVQHALAKLLTQAWRVCNRVVASELALVLVPDPAKTRLRMRLRSMARADAEAAVEKDPGSAEAWCNLGDALSDLARYGAAVACYDKALALAPSGSTDKKRTAAMAAITGAHPSGRQARAGG